MFDFYFSLLEESNASVLCYNSLGLSFLVSSPTLTIFLFLPELANLFKSVTPIPHRDYFILWVCVS